MRMEMRRKWKGGKGSARKRRKCESTIDFERYEGSMRAWFVQSDRASQCVKIPWSIGEGDCSPSITEGQGKMELVGLLRNV
jgi:hypothetical protein